MKLPNNEYAYIPPAKLLDYLLSETHSVGKSKSKYLRSSGFNEANVGSTGFCVDVIPVCPESF
jgi:hypothetical protein